MRAREMNLKQFVTWMFTQKDLSPRIYRTCEEFLSACVECNFDHDVRADDYDVLIRLLYLSDKNKIILAYHNWYDAIEMSSRIHNILDQWRYDYGCTDFFITPRTMDEIIRIFTIAERPIPTNIKIKLL